MVIIFVFKTVILVDEKEKICKIKIIKDLE